MCELTVQHYHFHVLEVHTDAGVPKIIEKGFVHPFVCATAARGRGTEISLQEIKWI